METLLTERDDLEWARDVHGINIDGIAAIVIEGNEDAPSRLTLYTADHVDAIRYVIEPGDDGNLRVVPPAN